MYDMYTKEPGQLAKEALAYSWERKKAGRSVSFDSAASFVMRKHGCINDCNGEFKFTIVAIMQQIMKQRKKEKKERKERQRREFQYEMPERINGHWRACPED